MVSILKYLLIIFVLAIPYTALADDSDADKNTKNCPKSLQSALESINTHLKNKQWININHNDCPQIQTEIIQNVDKIAKSENLDNYLPLMNKDTLKIARNAFFAIKGYKFKDATLQEHFDKYPWYSPTKESVSLTDTEKQKVNMIKNIEDNWIMHCKGGGFCRPPQPLPSKVRIEEKHGRKLLYMDKAVLDITRTSKEYKTDNPDYPAIITTDFSINGIAQWNSVLVCSWGNNFAGLSLKDIILYSNNGKELFRFNKNKYYTNGCPFWIPQRPDILISYKYLACCSGRWGYLQTFNKKLEPITLIDCDDGACGEVALFYELNHGDVYYYMETRGDKYNIETKYSIPVYSYSTSNDYSNDSFVKSLWLINKDGTLNAVSEAKFTCHRVYSDKSKSSWRSVCNKPEPIVDLYSNSHYQDNIATSINLKDKILLFWTGRNNATTIVPLPH